MSDRALVAYATRHGSTAEIAEAIATELRACGIGADVRPARDVPELGGYRLVIVGSAVYMNTWQPDAIDFLERLEDDLAGRPTWLFSSGPIGGTPQAEAKLRELLASPSSPPGNAGRWAQRIGTRGHAMFGGRVTDEMTGRLEQWAPRGDWRDFDAIRRWAREIAAAASAEPGAEALAGEEADQ